MIDKIADMMIEEGIMETTENNYMFFVEEISQRFNLNKEEVLCKAQEILAVLDSREEVAESSFEQDDYFDITFYSDYCKEINYYEIPVEEETETKENNIYYIADWVWSSTNIIEYKELVVVKDIKEHLSNLRLKPYTKVICDNPISDLYFENHRYVVKTNENARFMRMQYMDMDKFEKIARRTEPLEG